ncbi:winged helix-turn-helix domain-containing protein [Lysobacter niabensis]|uniref:winged helix-turn-helix domain-containing protein n=1 Tax=Agrilutibacter niabensis TaxID=380628 RepID=UPI00360A94EF
MQIDLRYRRVIRPDQEAELPQRMFDLLLVFLAEPQVLHNRAELFARVWPGVIVEDANLSQSVWMLRKALGESRKHWIRTVAKSGYVFEPPGAVEIAAEAPAPAAPPAAGATVTADANSKESPAAASAPGMVEAPVAPAASIPDRRPRRWGRWAGAAALVLALAGGIAWWSHHQQVAREQRRAVQLAIALIDVEDAAAPEDSRWPVTLLHAWLGWKLDSLPEVTLLTEAHLAADSAGHSPRIVFLSSGVDSANPNRVFLRARFDHGGVEQRLEKQGTPAQLPEMADELSQELLAALVPARASERWPALAADTNAARRYAEGVEAMERRDWVQSADILQDVVRLAPQFGLPRMQLGYVLSRLSRAAPAIEQTETALRLLQPIPDDVADVLDAERLSRNPEKFEEAAKAWGQLAAKHPQKRAYTLEQAANLNVANLHKEALALLNHPDWDKQSAGIRLRQRLNLAYAYLSLGDPKRARENALAAERIAAAAGKGWAQERGDALLLAAQTDSYQYEEKADLSGYEAAAKQFELAGNEMDALYARFLAESSRRDQPPESGLDALLAQARERGYRRLETEMLHLVALRHYERGDMPAYRARLEQALATALNAGDLYEQRMLELHLLNEDFLRGQFDSASRRITSLGKVGLQGDIPVWLSSYQAIIHAQRGRLVLAESVLDQGEKRDRDTNPGQDHSEASARFACVRADLRLVMGDTQRARANWKKCGAPESPSSRLQARIGNATVDLAAGDRSRAREQLLAAQKEVGQLPDGPDRWATELWIATSLTRAGDAATAERMLQRILPLARATQYEWMIAITETSLAETAATRGDWKAVRKHSEAARKLGLAGIWTLSNRLDVLDAVSAINEGDNPRALRILANVHAQAIRNNDAISQLEVQSLLPPGMAIGECNERCQAALLASTGLRGATLDWLVVPAKVDTKALLQRNIR